MSLGTPTHLGTASAAGAGSVTTNSISPTSGGLILLAVGGNGTALRTVSGVPSGLSGTWVAVDNENYNDGSIHAAYLFVGTGCTGSGTVSATFSAAWSGSVFYSWIEIPSGWDPTTPIPQFASNNVLPTAGSLTVTLGSSFVDAANNMAIGFFLHRIQEALTAGSGFTKLGETQTAVPVGKVTAWEYQVGQDLSVDMSWSTTSRGAIGIALEVNAAAGGGSVALDGSASMALTTSADMVVAEAVAGQADMALGTTAALSIAQAVAGQADMVLGTTGALSIAQAVAGQADMALSTTADLTVTGAGLTLDGSAAMALTTSADLGVAQALAGQADMALTTAADLGVARPLDGQADAVLGTTAALSLGVGLAGQADMVLGTTADLRLSEALAGSAAMALTTSADLTVTAPFLLTEVEWWQGPIVFRWDHPEGALLEVDQRWDSDGGDFRTKWVGHIEGPRWVDGLIRKEL